MTNKHNMFEKIQWENSLKIFIDLRGEFFLMIKEFMNKDIVFI